MKSRVKNVITIDGPSDIVYDEIWECEKWPSYSPGCLEVKILEKNGHKMRRFLKAEMNNRVVEMVTDCQYIPKEGMTFQQVQSPWPLSGNRGEWKFINENGKTRIELTHVLESNIPVVGWFLVKYVISRFYTYKQSKRVLEKLKERIENKEYLN